ncbi:MAG: hypothetical protein R3F55_16785 [Alphaproteobacteria bacterium]
MSALSDFRANPDTAIEKYDFMVDARGFKTTKLPGVTNCEYGGPCTLTEAKPSNGVTRLAASNGGSDYLFPWVNRGVGEVNVLRAAPNGTMVVTGGMNGCSLEVRSNGPHLIFYHDADSNRLGVLKAAQGTLECRIEPRVYTPLDLGEKIVGETIGDGSAYFHQLLAVKHGGKWKIYACGIIIGPGIEMPVKKAFRATVTKLMATID